MNGRVKKTVRQDQLPVTMISVAIVKQIQGETLQWRE